MQFFCYVVCTKCKMMNSYGGGYKSKHCFCLSSEEMKNLYHLEDNTFNMIFSSMLISYHQITINLQILRQIMLLFKIISQFKLRIFSSEGKNYFLRCNRYENIKLQTYQSVTLSVSSIFKNNLNVTLYRKFCTLLFIS